MKAKLFFLVTILTVLCYSGIAYAGEEITLTTYYPAPYGEYNSLSVGDPTAGYTATTPGGLLVQGNVGIGTTSPFGKLDVNSAEILGNFIDDDGDGLTDEQEDVIFTINGNVGIGTTAPACLLDVVGTPVVSGDTRSLIYACDNSSFAQGVGGGISFGGRFNSAGAFSVDQGWIKGIKENATDGNMAGALVFGTKPSGAPAAERMRITSNGNVGIGTTSPQRKLHIAKGNLPCIQLTNDTSGHGLLDGSIISQNGTALNIVNQESSLGAMYFYPGNTWVSSPSVAFRENGSVGIGTTSPGARLDVSGSGAQTVAIITANDGITYLSDWPVTWGGGLATWDICCASIRYTGLQTRSDIRLKKNIQDIENGLDFIKQLRGISYEHKEGNLGIDYGFIAQELEPIMPSLVGTDDKGYKSINTIGLTPFIVKAIQEQQQQIESQQKQMEELKADNEDLKATIKTLEAKLNIGQ